MSTQPAFDFDPQRAARSTDPETSRAAAEAIAPVVTRDCMVALGVFYAGAERDFDDFELEAATGIKQTSVGCRRKQLERLGYVEWTRKRPSSSGLTRREVNAFRITEAGIHFYARVINK